MSLSLFAQQVKRLQKLWTPDENDPKIWTPPPLTDPKTLFKQGEAGAKEPWWNPVLRIAHHVKGRVHDGLTLDIFRRNRRGRPYVQNTIRFGPNHVHHYITHKDGSITMGGVGKNLLTNIGRDVWAQSWGAIKTQNNPATATSGTTLTGTGSTWTATNLATPELGNAGLRVVAPVTGITTAPVYGNIISNTTSVLTLDGWWVSSADTPGTTPAATNNFAILRGGMSAIRYMALTTNASAASATNNTLTGEITAGGAERALATYSHTFGNSGVTLSKSFSITATHTAIHRAGLFTALHTGGATGSDPMVYESVLTPADATVVNGDTLSVSWNGTLSGT